MWMGLQQIGAVAHRMLLNLGFGRKRKETYQSNSKA